MKKILIAGATSIALAAMPIVGVFAADPAPVKDTLTVTVDESCTFTRTGAGEYTQAMEAGELKENFASSTFTAKCNNAKGYTIGAVFTDLAQSNGDGDEIVYSQTQPTANSGTWTAQIGNGANIAASDGVLANTSTMDPAAGSTYVVNYHVSLHDNQAKGTYTGTATYTLTQKAN